MTTPDNLDVASIISRLDRLERGGGGGQCTADNPHDTMTWDRRQYRCRCGKQYMKDGLGGLREVD